MGSRKACARATRGVSKAKKHGDSSSSNPTTKKFRSQYNSLNKIAKEVPNKKNSKKRVLKKLAKDALSSQKKVDSQEKESSQ